MAKTLKHFQEAGHTAYAFIKANPGCCAADVDRARRTARGGHKWMYNTIERLVKRGARAPRTRRRPL